MARKRLFGPAQLASGPATLYTVPAGMRATLDYLRLENPSASAIIVTVSITPDAAGTRVYQTSVPAAVGGVAGFIQENGLKWTLQAAEVIQVTAGTAATVVAVADGNQDAV